MTHLVFFLQDWQRLKPTKAAKASGKASDNGASRPVKKGVQNTENRNIKLEYLTIEPGKIGLFRAKLLHSFTSENKASAHAGSICAAMKVCAVRESVCV